MRKPYKMKGSEFFGHGSDSPAKVSDSDVREAVSKVNEGQMAFKEPGWAKVAGAAHKAAMGPLSKMMKKKGGGAPESESTPGSGGGAGDVGSVQKTASSKLLPEDYKLGDLGGGAKI